MDKKKNAKGQLDSKMSVIQNHKVNGINFYICD